MIQFLFTFLKDAWPYILVAGMGFSTAWGVQSHRLESLELTFREYKITQNELTSTAKKQADNLRERTANDWAQNLTALRACYESGKCGLRNLPASRRPASVPSPSGIDATGTNPIPAPGEPPAQVIEDCAVTTLQLNQLQGQIEQQGN